MAIETLTTEEEEKSSIKKKRKNRPPYALLSGKSALRGVPAFTRPQKAAMVELLLEKDQDICASPHVREKGATLLQV